MKRDPAWAAALCRAYAILLFAYPLDFRRRFGVEMRQVFGDRCRAIATSPKPGPLIRFLFATAKDWILSSTKERLAGVATMATIILNSWQRRTARGLAVAVFAVLGYLFVTTELVQAYVISAPSMEPSLRVGDHILVDKLAASHALNRGDLVVFRYPEDPRLTFVKRVIGLPGDQIRLVDKQVFRNGRFLVEPYAQHLNPDSDPYRDNFPVGPSVKASRRGLDMLAHNLTGSEVTVPAGSIFVLGDNRDNSLDSRYWGFVPIENVTGRPMFKWSRIQRAGP